MKPCGGGVGRCDLVELGVGKRYSAALPGTTVMIGRSRLLTAMSYSEASVPP